MYDRANWFKDNAQLIDNNIVIVVVHVVVIITSDVLEHKWLASHRAQVIHTR